MCRQNTMKYIKIYMHKLNFFIANKNKQNQRLINTLISIKNLFVKNNIYKIQNKIVRS